MQRERPLKLDRVLTAHERRARLIAKMHRQAMETANNLLNQHQGIEAGLVKVAKDRGAEGLKLSRVPLS